MSLGERLRKLREKLNKSQLGVANDLKIRNAQLSRYEANLQKPDPELIKKLADYYETTTDYLFGRTDVSIPDPKINPKEQRQFETFINNPDHGTFIREYLEAPEGRKKELMFFWRIIKEAEGHKPKPDDDPTTPIKADS